MALALIISKQPAPAGARRQSAFASFIYLGDTWGALDLVGAAGYSTLADKGSQRDRVCLKDARIGADDEEAATACTTPRMSKPRITSLITV